MRGNGEAWRLRLLAAILMAGLTVLLAGGGVEAAPGGPGPKDKFRSGQHVVVASDETVPHDLYVAATTLTVNGRIEGDLFAVARQVTISGEVRGDLFALGAQVTIDGTVGGSVRAVGGVVSAQGHVSGDVLAGSLFLDVGPAASVEGDIVYASVFNRVAGQVAGGTLTVGRSHRRQAPAPRLALALPAGRSIPAALPPPEASLLGGGGGGSSAVTAFLVRYLSIIAVGGVLIWLVRRTSWSAAAFAGQRPFASMGTGVIALGIAIGILLLFTGAVIGLSYLLLSSIGSGAFFFASLFIVMVAVLLGEFTLVLTATVLGVIGSYALFSLCVGRMLLGGGQRAVQTLSDRAPDSSHEKGLDRASWVVQSRPVPALLVGAIVVSILVLLPGLIGTVFTVLAVVVGVGALVLSVRQREVAGAAGTPQPPAAGPMAADGAVAAPVTVM